MVKSIEQELELAKSAVNEKQILCEKHVSTVSELEKSIRDHDNNREGRLKDLERKVKTTKAHMQSASKDLKVNSDTVFGSAFMDFEGKRVKLYEVIMQCFYILALYLNYKKVMVMCVCRKFGFQL